MARSARQSKILELISTKEIETQDELANIENKINGVANIILLLVIFRASEKYLKIQKSDFIQSSKFLKKVAIFLTIISP